MLAAAAPAEARSPRTSTADGTGSIRIRILDVPAARLADPRANAYIVDYLKPGTTIRRRIEIANTSGVTQHVEVYAGAAAVVHDAFIGADGRTGNELSSWVSVDAPSIDIAAGQSVREQVTVAVPDNASTGERYAAIWGQVSRAPTAGNSIGQINRVGIRMYLDVGPGGEPPTDFQITSMAVSTTAGPWPVVIAQVHNTGGRAVDMSGSISLSYRAGVIKAGPFAATGGVTILPGQSGPVDVLLDEPLPGGRWDADLTLVSGLVKRTTSSTLTLPGPPATARAATPAKTSHLPIFGIGMGVLLLLVLVLTWYLVRRRRPDRA